MRMAPTKYLVPDGQPHKGDAVLAPPAHTLHCLGSLCFCLLICKQQLIAVIRAFFFPPDIITTDVVLKIIIKKLALPLRKSLCLHLQPWCRNMLLLTVRPLIGC